MTAAILFPQTYVGAVRVDAVSLDKSIDFLINHAKSKLGGYVVTPNVDHIVQAARDARLAKAYQESLLSLPDGAPVAWLATSSTKHHFPKVSGADIIVPLCQRANEHNMSIFMLGGAPGVAENASHRLRTFFPSLQIAGVDSPPVGFDADSTLAQKTIEKIKNVTPSFVFVALGCPKQEWFMHRYWRDLRPSILLGIGGSLDFLTGKTKRAPSWISRMGLEWCYRLFQEPRRLASRYLYRDLAFLPILFSTLRKTSAVPTTSCIGPGS